MTGTYAFPPFIGRNLNGSNGSEAEIRTDPLPNHKQISRSWVVNYLRCPAYGSEDGEKPHRNFQDAIRYSKEVAYDVKSKSY